MNKSMFSVIIGCFIFGVLGCQPHVQHRDHVNKGNGIDDVWIMSLSMSPSHQSPQVAYATRRIVGNQHIFEIPRSGTASLHVVFTWTQEKSTATVSIDQDEHTWEGTGNRVTANALIFEQEKFIAQLTASGSQPRIISFSKIIPLNMRSPNEASYP